MKNFIKHLQGKRFLFQGLENGKEVPLAKSKPLELKDDLDALDEKNDQLRKQFIDDFGYMMENDVVLYREKIGNVQYEYRFQLNPHDLKITKINLSEEKEKNDDSGHSYIESRTSCYTSFKRFYADSVGSLNLRNLLQRKSTESAERVKNNKQAFIDKFINDDKFLKLSDEIKSAFINLVRTHVGPWDKSDYVEGLGIGWTGEWECLTLKTKDSSYNLDTLLGQVDGTSGIVQFVRRLPNSAESGHITESAE